MAAVYSSAPTLASAVGIFRLSKWYLDLVTDDGTVLIVYAAVLEWARIRLDYASTLVARPGAEAVERSAWSGVQLPEAGADPLRIHHAGLRLTGEWHRAASPIRATLLEDAEGTVQWDCLLPNATATVSLAGAALAGRGYAERLTLTRPPWRLPLHQLRWGRFTGSSRSAAWIAWQGSAPQQWIWLDGVLQPGASLDASGLDGLDDGEVSLRLTPERVLSDRAALQVMSRHMPRLEALPLGPLAHLHELKRLARGTVRHRGAVVDEGWVIDEDVTW